MYKAEPNDTKHSERPFLVRNRETDKIVRYCSDLEEAEGHARRINKAFYPNSATGDEPVSMGEPEVGGNLSLF